MHDSIRNSNNISFMSLTDMLSIIDEVPYESGDSVSTANMEN